MLIRDWFPGADKAILDANLLAVLAVGQEHSNLFGHSPVDSYNSDDYDLIIEMISEFDGLISTPYIIAETSALLTKTGYARIGCRSSLASFISSMEITYDAPDLLCRHNHYPAYGIADISLLHALKKDAVVITADGPLTGLLKGAGLYALHYQELRNAINALK